MAHDRHAALLPRLRALNALVGKCMGALQRALRQTDSLDAHGEARRIHHDEHVLETAVLLADELSEIAPILFSVVVIFIFLYIPGIEVAILSSPIPVAYFFFPMAFGIWLLFTDETRKYFVRKYPKSLVAKMAW